MPSWRGAQLKKALLRIVDITNNGICSFLTDSTNEYNIKSSLKSGINK
jgi:hypothetical protein